MTRITDWDFLCPNCGTTFKSPLLLSTTLMQPTQTDFRHRFVSGNPAQYHVHSCHRCGFSGTLDSFETTISDDVRALVSERLSPLSQDQQAQRPWLKFDHAAQIAIWSGAAFQEIADLFIRAAHVCQDCESREDERRYRANAADFLTMAMQDEDFEPDAVAQTTYMIGEHYRRAGDLPKAREWLTRAETCARKSPDLAWLADLAARQRDNPSEYLEPDEEG